MVEKFSNRFCIWQNYLHYILLAFGLGAYIGLVSLFGGKVNIWKLLITIFLIDTGIHALFWYLPKKLRWRD